MGGFCNTGLVFPVLARSYGFIIDKEVIPLRFLIKNVLYGGGTLLIDA